MHVRLQQIWHAVTLAETGSYTLAAQRVHLSQPALSRSIQRLEAEFNAVLFDRTTDGVVPTTVGSIVVERGAALIRATRELQREVELTLGLETGQLRIGAGTYSANLSVGKACGLLLAEHPGLELTVRVGDWPQLLDGVLEGKLDIAVVETSSAAEDERLVIEQLPQHHGHFFCRAGHPLSKSHSLTLAEIQTFPLVTASLPARFKNLPTTIRVDTFSLLRDIVLNSDSIGMATTIQIERDARTSLLCKLPLDLPYLHTSYGFVSLRSRTPSPATLAFMARMREVEAKLV